MVILFYHKYPKREINEQSISAYHPSSKYPRGMTQNSWYPNSDHLQENLFFFHSHGNLRWWGYVSHQGSIVRPPAPQSLRRFYTSILAALMTKPELKKKKVCIRFQNDMKSWISGYSIFVLSDVNSLTPSGTFVPWLGNSRSWYGP